jgi:alkaline phosphatase
MDRMVDNTYLFEVMCRYFGLSHRNPSMTARQAQPLIQSVSARDWQQHLKLHIA